MKFEKITTESLHDILCIFEKLSYFDCDQIKNYFDELCNLQIWKKVEIWISLFKFFYKGKTRKYKNEYI